MVFLMVLKLQLMALGGFELGLENGCFGGLRQLLSFPY